MGEDTAPLTSPVVVTPPDAPPMFDGIAPPAPVQGAAKRKAGRPRTKAAAPPPPSGAGAAPRGDAAPKRVGRPSKSDELTDKVADLYGIGALVVSWVSPSDGRIVAEHAQSCAEAWVAYSKDSPAIAKLLDRLTTGSALGAVLIAHGGMAWKIAQNHELVPVPQIAAGDGPAGTDGLGSSPAAFPPGFDFDAIMQDPARLAALGTVFNVDIPTGANGST